jgi:hypothetical protein
MEPYYPKKHAISIFFAAEKRRRREGGQTVGIWALAVGSGPLLAMRQISN